MLVLPFEVQIPEAEQDRELPKKLRRELSGILNWALEGWRRFQDRGRLEIPKKVRMATADYRGRMDALGGFLEECTTSDGFPDVVFAKDIYQSYTGWCFENGEKPLAKRTFGQRLEDKGYTRTRATGGAREYDGLALNKRGLEMQKIVKEEKKEEDGAKEAKTESPSSRR